MSYIRVTEDHTAEVLRSIEGMIGKSVLIGVPEAENPRSADPAAPRSSGPIGNASLAYIHDNGSPKRNIPARPFLKVGVEQSFPRALKEFKVYAVKAFRDPAQLDAGLKAAGTIASESVRKRITSQVGFAPLGPATLAARRRAGIKSKKALIRIGSMLRSITYVVVGGR